MCVFSTYSSGGQKNPVSYCDIYLLFYTRQNMACEPINIIWQYLILFTFLLELVFWIKILRKVILNFGEAFSAVLHRTCNTIIIKIFEQLKIKLMNENRCYKICLTGKGNFEDAA